MRHLLIDSAYTVNAMDCRQRGAVPPIDVDALSIVHKGNLSGHSGRHVPVWIAHFNELYRAAHRVLLSQLLQNFRPDAHGKHMQ